LNKNRLFFFGFSIWKRDNIINFFQPLNKKDVYFCKNLQDAIKKGLDNNSKVIVWGKKDFYGLENYIKRNNIPLLRVEDGFIRSISLGSDLTKAYSLVVDSKGIYFDPTSESDLEYLLKNTNFSKELLQRARKLKDYLIEKKLSKYNIDKDKVVTFKTVKKIVLVIGQVEDDASIIYGGNNMTNLELLKKVYKIKKDEYIIYKPHPDVLAGNRKGNIDTVETLKYAKEIMVDISLPSLLDISDEVHTITSLSGFEALIRDKVVFTYGLPFYAGWGLTVDDKKCVRRDKKLTIDQLIATTYILYPKYIDPKTDKYCEVEVLIAELEKQKNRYSNDSFYRFFIKSKNYVSRKLQLFIKIVRLENI